MCWKTIAQLLEFTESQYAPFETGNLWVIKLKNSKENQPNRNTGDLAKDHLTEYFTRVALVVADMPDELGGLLDKGIKDHFSDR